MVRQDAERFAKCLRANDRFTAVEVEESPQARHPKIRFFVAFAPTSQARIEAFFARQQDARQGRADDEGRGFVFVLDNDGSSAFLWCHNPRSGETYEVTEHSCSCADWEWRCQGSPVKCKHQLALRGSVARREVATWERARAEKLDGPAFSEPRTQIQADDERRALVLRDRELLWG